MKRSFWKRWTASLSLLLGVVPASYTQTTYNWNADATANWGSTGNWTPVGTPVAGDTANINTAFTGSRTITVNGVFSTGTLAWSATGVGFTHNLSRGSNPNDRLIMDNGANPANINITTGDYSFNTATLLQLNNDLNINLTASGALTGSRSLRFNGAMLSSTARTITINNTSGFTGGSRSPLSFAPALDNMPAGTTVRIIGTGNTDSSNSVDLENAFGSNISFDFDITKFVRSTSITIRGTTNFSTTNSPGGTFFSSNQGNSGNTNLRFAGALTGGGANHAISFQGTQAQYYLDNPNPTSTYTGTIRLVTEAPYMAALWVSRDDQFGNSSNPIQFASGNTTPMGGGLSITQDLTTARNIQLGSNGTSTAAAFSVNTPEGTTLTLNGAAGQVSRITGSTSTGNSLVKNGPGTLVLTGNSSFGATDTYQGVSLISGVLRLNNVSTNVQNRLRMTTTNANNFRLSNARLEFLGGNTAAQVETIARPLNSLIGGSEVIVGNGAGQTSTITFSSLVARTTSQTRGVFGTLNFDTAAGSADPIGSPNNRVLFTTAPTLTNGILSVHTRVGNDWATYATPNGISAFTGYADLATATATDNARLTAAFTLPAIQTVNTLKLEGNIPFDLGTNALTITTGGIMNTGTGSLTNGTIAVGSNPITLVDNGALNFGLPIPTVAFIKTGTGTTTLSNIGNAQLATIINQGTLVISSDAQLGGAMTFAGTPSGYISIAGGTLRISATLTTSRAVVLGGIESSHSNVAVNGAPYSRNVIQVDSGVTATFNSKFTGGTGHGSVAFIKTGEGTLVMNNISTSNNNSTGFGLVNTNSAFSPNDFLGNVVIQEGILRISNLTNGGDLGISYSGNPSADVNDVIFRGGTLEVFAPVASNSLSIGGGTNSRAFYVENGGGTIRFGNMSVARSFNISGTEGLLYRGTNPGPFSILQDSFGQQLSVNFIPTSNAAATQETIWRITSSTSNYIGTTTIAGGTVLVGVDAPVSAPGAFGSGATSITFGSTGFNPIAGANSALLIDTPGVTIARSIAIFAITQTPDTFGRITIGGNHTTGTSTYSGAVALPRGAHLSAASGGTVNFTAVVSGAGFVNKVGGGIVSLNGANTYSGGTTVTEGTLRVNNATGSGTGTGAVNVLTGGTFGGAGRFTGASTISGTIAPGNSVGQLNAAGAMTWAPGGTYQFEFTPNDNSVTPVNGTTHDHINSTAALNVTATNANPFTIQLAYVGTGTTFGPVTLTIATFGSTPTIDPANFIFTGAFAPSPAPTIAAVGNDVQITFTPVPEPTTLLGLAGLAGVLLKSRSRRQS